MGIERSRLSNINEGLDGKPPLSSVSVSALRRSCKEVGRNPLSRVPLTDAATGMLPSPNSAKSALSFAFQAGRNRPLSPEWLD